MECEISVTAIISPYLPEGINPDTGMNNATENEEGKKRWAVV